MSTSALTGRHSTDLRVLPDNQGDDGLHPDVLAYAEQLEGAVTPYRLRWLQRQYDRGLLHRERRESETPVLVMTMGRRGSVPVDKRVGERIANRNRRS